MGRRKRRQIVRISLGMSNAYIVTGDKQAILIDTGKKGNEGRIAIALRSVDLSFGNIGLIILTHTHYDHCGSLKALKELTDAKILVHRDEAEFLKQGYCEFPKGTLWFSKAIAWIGRTMAKGMAKYPAASADITIGERFGLSEFGIEGYILPTPGHTSGSISVILNDTHAIVGDTLFNIFRSSVFPPFANNREELLKSWRMLDRIGCKHYYPGHRELFGRDKFTRTYETEKK